MKTLLLMRHAKSSWENSDLSDYERPLNPRGLESAPLTGNLIHKRKLFVDLFLSSPAKRARQTAVMIKEAAQIAAEIHYEEKIYEASSLRLLQTISAQENGRKSILLVGHNPGLEGLIKILTGETIEMKTAALAKINLNIENWSDIAPESGKLEFLERPEKTD